MTHILYMRFVETSVFTKQVTQLLPDSSYRILQSDIMNKPDTGAVIKGSGGLRKIRWALPGYGKRGSLRIIYYFDRPDTIYMIFMYKKNDQSDLTPEQLKILKRMVQENLL